MQVRVRIRHGREKATGAGGGTPSDRRGTGCGSRTGTDTGTIGSEEHGGQVAGQGMVPVAAIGTGMGWSVGRLVGWLGRPQPCH